MGTTLMLGCLPPRRLLEICSIAPPVTRRVTPAASNAVECGERLAKTRATTDMRLRPGVGHFVPVEAPQVFAFAVQEGRAFME